MEKERKKKRTIKDFQIERARDHLWMKKIDLVKRATGCLEIEAVMALQNNGFDVERAIIDYNNCVLSD